MVPILVYSVPSMQPRRRQGKTKCRVPSGFLQPTHIHRRYRLKVFFRRYFGDCNEIPKPKGLSAGIKPSNSTYSPSVQVAPDHLAKARFFCLTQCLFASCPSHLSSFSQSPIPLFTAETASATLATSSAVNRLRQSMSTIRTRRHMEGFPLTSTSSVVSVLAAPQSLLSALVLARPVLRNHSAAVTINTTGSSTSAARPSTSTSIEF